MSLLWRLRRHLHSRRWDRVIGMDPGPVTVAVVAERNRKTGLIRIVEWRTVGEGEDTPQDTERRTDRAVR